MSNATLMPFVLPRQFTLDGKPLSGGKLYFYQSGTSTPKQTFATADKSVINPNPVVLDASGFAPVYLDVGAYRVIVFDSTGVQIEQPMDGVTANGSGGFGDTAINMFAVGTYADLRGLQTEYDMVYVGGRSFGADGGEGWFYHDPNSQLSDDDGMILTSNAGATKYIRLNQNYIDPRFYGVVYNSAISQYTNLTHALSGSVQFGLAIEVCGNIYLNQNIVIPAKASIKATETGFFTSTAGITMTFTSTSNFSAVGKTFGQTVSPIFQADTVNEVMFSWIGGNVVDDRWTKFIGSSSVVTLNLNESVSLYYPTLNIPNTFITTNNAVISATPTTPSVSITMPKLVTNNSQVFSITSATTITSLDIGDWVKPEVFGAKGDYTSNDTLAIKQAIVSGKVLLTKGKGYRCIGSLGAITNLNMKGSTLTFDSPLSVSSLRLDDMIMSYGGSGNWVTGNSLVANYSVISNVYSVSNAVINGCEYFESARGPVYDGSPSIYNAHLPLIKDAPSLYTDSNGKIGKRLWQEGKSWTVEYCANTSQIYTRIRYLNGVWIIVGNNGLIKTSTDMVNWTVRTSGVTTFLVDVAWNGTYYVAIGDSSTYLRSSDLVTWAPAASRPNTNGTNQTIVSNGGRFVTTEFQSNGQIITSTDGLNWTLTYPTITGPIGNMVVYGNGLYVVGGRAGRIWTSYDGATWTEKSIPIPNPDVLGEWFTCGIYNPTINQWIFLSSSMAALTSDPTTNNWAVSKILHLGGVNDVIKVGDTLVAVGSNKIITSPNGAFWSSRYSNSYNLYGLAANGYDVYAVGASELILKADK